MGFCALREPDWGREMRSARLVLSVPVALLGLWLVGIVFIGTPPTLVGNELSNSVLVASMGLLLVALAAVITFK